MKTYLSIMILLFVIDAACLVWNLSTHSPAWIVALPTASMAFLLGLVMATIIDRWVRR